MQGLKERARTGVLWMTLAVAASALVQIVRVVILARYFLEPADFGLIALVIAIIYVLAAVSDLGTSSALLHRQDATRNELSSVFWFNVVLGFAFCGIASLLAPFIARASGEPRITALLQVMAVSFAFDGFATPLIVLLRRELEFRRASLAEAYSVLGGSAVTLLLAVLGLGVWALAAGIVMQTFVRAVLVLHWGWARFDLGVRLRRAELRGFLGFGAYQVAERAVSRVSDRLGQLLLDPISGPVQLGIYSIAANLATVPMLQILPIVGQTATPILSKAQADEQRLRRGYFLATEILMTVLAPVFLGLFVIAPALVPLLLGAKWAEAGAVFQVVCLTCLFYSYYFFSGALVIAKGRGMLGFGWRLGLLAASVAPAYYGARWGNALGLSIGIAGVTILAMVPYYLLVVRRLLGPCLPQVVLGVGAPLTMGAVMAVLVAVLGSVLAAWNPLLTVAVQIGAGAMLYGVLVCVCRPGIAREILLVIPLTRMGQVLGSVRSAPAS